MGDAAFIVGTIVYLGIGLGIGVVVGTKGLREYTAALLLWPIVLVAYLFIKVWKRLIS